MGTEQESTEVTMKRKDTWNSTAKHNGVLLDRRGVGRELVEWVGCGACGVGRGDEKSKLRTAFPAEESERAEDRRIGQAGGSRKYIPEIN